MAFLHRLTGNHDVSDTEFLVNAADYLIVLFRRGVSGQLNYFTETSLKSGFRP